MNYSDQVSNENLLTPVESRWRCEAWLTDTRHLLSTNQFNEYLFGFQPQTCQDYQLLEELIEFMISLVEMRRGPHSIKTRMRDTGTRVGSRVQAGQGTAFMCSQLFAPRLNVKVEHPDLLYGKMVSLSGHIRDTKDGRLYLQCDYIDVYDDVDQALGADALPLDASSTDFAW